MPGLVIHLAIGKIYEQNNKIDSITQFEKGIIAPDLTNNKIISHYRKDLENSDLNWYIEEKGISENYNEGYFLHLVTDYLFYNYFLQNWSEDIYEDYDKLNDKMVQEFQIIIPEEMKDIVKSKQGKLALLDEEKIYRFIDIVGKMNIREIVFKNNDCQKQIEKEFLEKFNKN